MNKKLAGFLLSWKWYFKKANYKKAKIRSSIASKFRDTKEYKDGTWTTELFNSTYHELELLGML